MSLNGEQAQGEGEGERDRDTNVESQKRNVMKEGM